MPRRRAVAVFGCIAAVARAPIAESRYHDDDAWCFFKETPATLATEPYVPPALSTSATEAAVLPTYFVIVSSARSATNSLVAALDANADVQCHHEAFNKAGALAFGWEPERTAAERDADRRGFMERLFTARDPHKASQGLRAVGFKVFEQQLTRREFEALARAPHVRKIVVERLDTLAQFVSFRTAQKTDVWVPGQRNRVRDAAESAAKPAPPDREEIARLYPVFCERLRSWFHYVYDLAAVSAPSSWLFVTTEDLVASEYTLRKIYDHLAVPRGKLMPYDPYTNRTGRRRSADAHPNSSCAIGIHPEPEPPAGSWLDTT